MHIVHMHMHMHMHMHTPEQVLRLTKSWLQPVHQWLQPVHLWLQPRHLWLQVLRLDAEAQLAQARHEAQLAPVAESMPTTPPRGPRGGLPPETMPMPTMPVMPLPRAAFRRAYLLCFGKMHHAFRKDMLEAFAYFDTDDSGSLIMAILILTMAVRPTYYGYTTYLLWLCLLWLYLL